MPSDPLGRITYPLSPKDQPMTAPITLATTDWMGCPARLPAGVSEAVIGDVHGYADHLDVLLAAIGDTAPDAHLTLLGDLIDRGPHSLRALVTGLEAVRLRGSHATFLPGNHEQMFLLTLQNPQSNAGASFALNGGLWLLRDHYLNWECPRAGPMLDDLVGPTLTPVATQDGSLLGAFGSDRPRLHRSVGNLLLVHAGIDPDAPDPVAWIEDARFDRLDDHHPLWIRDIFHDHRGPYPTDVVVVHGHTPESRIRRGDGKHAPIGHHRFDGHRLGLDGGSYATGIVTAAIIEDGRYRVITAIN